MSQRPLKFCMVTTFYPPYNFGGDGIFVYRLTNELARRGHGVDVVHCVDAYRTVSGRRTPPVGDFPNHPNVTVHALHSPTGALSPLITHQTGHPVLKARPLRTLLSRGGHDVVHFHNMSLIGPAALSYGSGIKLYTMHEHWLVCPLHVLWKFDRMPCARKQCIPCTIRAKRPPQLWRYTRLLDAMLRHVDAFIAVSRFSREKHLEMGLVVDAPIEHIPYFVPHPSPPPPGIDTPPHPRPYYLVVGRLEKMKGVQMVIEAFRTFRECDLVIAGDGNYQAELQRLASGLSHVHFRGRLSYADLQPLFRHATALVVPSIGYETFGIVIAEAFVQRTPVIVHNLGALPEVVHQSGGGLIYEDAAGLLDALQALRGRPEVRRRLGDRGYDAYLRYWTPEAHLAQYFDLLERMGSRKRSRARSVGEESMA